MNGSSCVLKVCFEGSVDCSGGEMEISDAEKEKGGDRKRRAEVR